MFALLKKWLLVISLTFVVGVIGIAQAWEYIAGLKSTIALNKLKYMQEKSALKKKHKKQLTKLKTNHRKEITKLKVKQKKALAKTKIEAKAKRLLVGIPILGFVYAGWLEKDEFDKWKDEHPDGTFYQYGENVAELADEIKDELLDEYCDPNSYVYSIACSSEGVAMVEEVQ